MKITVLGAGAVGGYFGGRMAEAGLDITFLVREKRAEQLQKTGLVIRSPFGNSTFQPKLATEASEIEACDLVLLGVKNYHLDAAIESVRPLMEKGAKLLPLLNGVEHFQTLAELFGEGSILGGLCHIIATLDSEGQIVHTNQLHSLTIGALHPSQEGFCQTLNDLMSSANYSAKLSEKILVDIWHKYAFITAFSGVTTASRLPIDEVLACDPTENIYRLVLGEMWELAAEKGAPLPNDFVEKTMESTRKQPAGATSSMHQDFRKGLRLEVESLQGAAVRIAQQAGIEIPTTRTLYGLIKPYEYPRG